MKEELLTIHETAKALGLGVTKVYEIIASGDLKALKIGRLTRIPRSSVAEFIASLPEFIKAEG